MKNLIKIFLEEIRNREHVLWDGSHKCAVCGVLFNGLYDPTVQVNITEEAEFYMICNGHMSVVNSVTGNEVPCERHWYNFVRKPISQVWELMLKAYLLRYKAVLIIWPSGLHFGNLYLLTNGKTCQFVRMTDERWNNLKWQANIFGEEFTWRIK